MFRTKLTTAMILAGLALLASPGAATAADVTVGDLIITKPWTRVTPPGAKVAGGFLTITNKGESTDRLVGGSTEISGHIEIHEMGMDGGIMKMRELHKGLEIKPGETVELKPGSYHVMFMDLKASPAEGTPVKGMLKFENAGEAQIFYDVAPLGAKSAGGMDHGQMDQSGHDMKMQDHKHGH
jgi:copper(I)-binding protein